jgi:oligopeptide/dipeptide ABC transporter ATP-binding protein
MGACSRPRTPSHSETGSGISSSGGPGAGAALLEVRGLCTVYPTEKGKVQAVREVSLRVKRGGILGLVGESGCGKSATLLSIMRLVPYPGKIVAGEIWFNGEDLLRKTPAQMRAIRGKDIAMVFQDPMSALNPAYRVGDQIAESLRVHGLLPGYPRKLFGDHRRREREMVLTLMHEVGIPSPETRHLDYPHQFSGGMQQRVLIAIALACRPALLLADEPTTALDVTIQAQILDLMRRINEERGTAIILVTHDLGVAAEFCHEIAVMYAGQIVEWGRAEAVLEDPAHPYTRGLLCSIPRLSEKRRLVPIPGVVPDLTHPGPGCSFHPRCDRSLAACANTPPPLVTVGGGRVVRCLRYVEGGAAGASA